MRQNRIIYMTLLVGVLSMMGCVDNDVDNQIDGASSQQESAEFIYRKVLAVECTVYDSQGNESAPLSYSLTFNYDSSDSVVDVVKTDGSGKVTTRSAAQASNVSRAGAGSLEYSYSKSNAAGTYNESGESRVDCIYDGEYLLSTQQSRNLKIDYSTQNLEFVESGEGSYTWSDGNLVSELYQGVVTNSSDSEVSNSRYRSVQYDYSPYGNCLSVDLNEVIAYAYMRDVVQVGLEAGFSSKNLISKESYKEGFGYGKTLMYEYKYDAEGTPETISAYEVVGDEKLLRKVFIVIY